MFTGFIFHIRWVTERLQVGGKLRPLRDLGAVLTLLAVFYPQVAFGQSPLPDNFNPGANGEVSTLAVQGDGKILVGGAFTILGGNPRRHIGRLNADGTLDSQFNPGADDNVYSLALQLDGKILVGGNFTSLGGYPRNRIARLNADGTLDTGFDPGVGGIVFSLAVQTDGKILVGGDFRYQGRSHIARLNADGTLDDGFNPGLVDLLDAVVYSLAVQSDGKILVGGDFTYWPGQIRSSLARLNPDGTLDNSFIPGVGQTGYPYVSSLAVQSDGAILVAGDFDSLGAQTRINFGRLNADGTPDSGFDTNIVASPRYLNVVSSLTVQADGKILVGGYFTTLGGQSRTNIGRLNADGTLDLGFNPGANGVVSSLAVQPDGKILVGGSFTNLAGQPRNRIGRLNNSTAATQSLGYDGSTITWLRGGGSPDVLRTEFHYSPDGVTWTNLGAGVKITNGWQIAALSLPSEGALGARGFVSCGENSSGWFVEDYFGLGPPVLVSPPASQVCSAGETATFRVVAVSSQPLNYQWHKDGVPLLNVGQVSGAGTATLKVSNVLRANEGDYSLVASNSTGILTSLVARLTVNDPAIMVPPASAWKEAGDSVTFTLTAAGTPRLDYQWWHTGSPVPGATSNTLVLTNLQVGAPGEYFAVVSNQFGTAASAVALLTVNLATLDTGFNPGANGSVNALAVQPDGKILVGGSFDYLAGQWRSYICRLNADGTLDSGFYEAYFSQQVKCLAVQMDGKILVAPLGVGRNIARLNLDGTLDDSFTPPFANGVVNALALQADGKILVGGMFTTLGGQTRKRIARLNADGTLDIGFDPGAESGTANPTVDSLAIQVDGKILVGGAFGYLGRQSRECIGRLNVDGTLDITFGSGAGRNDGVYSSVRVVTVQADGKILVGGSFTFLNDQPRNGIGRLNSDGTLDEAFDPGWHTSVTVNALAVQADGKILVGGSFTGLAGQSRTNIVRLNSDGTLDSGFNSGANGVVAAMAVQPDGKILAGGSFTTLGGQPRNRIGRLNSSTPATQSLGYDGSTITWLRGGSSPELRRSSFDYSIDGLNFVNLGEGQRVVGGWQLTGVSAPINAALRARGFVAGPSSTDWFVEDISWSGSPGMARVMRVTPSGDLAGTIDSVDVWLTKPLASSTLGSLVRRPDGQHPTIRSVTLVGLGRYRITFDPQTQTGRYTVRFGPEVRDLIGNPLDQDGDGIPGELEDIFESSFNLVPVDLALSGPSTSTNQLWVNDAFTVSWSGHNVTGAPLLGNWEDAVYLSTLPYWTINNSIRLATVEHTGGLVTNGTYNASASVVVPAVLPGSYYLLVRADVANTERETSETNNVVAYGPFPVSLPGLATDGTPVNGTLTATNRTHWYAVQLPAGQSVRLNLTGLTNAQGLALYVGLSAIPTTLTNNFRSVGDLWQNPEVTIPASPTGGVAYVMISSERPTSDLPYQLFALASGSPLSLTPNRLANSGDAVVTLQGLGFLTNSTVRFIGTNGSVWNPAQVQFVSSNQLTLALDLRDLPAGSYGVEAVGTLGTNFAPQALELLPGETPLPRPGGNGEALRAGSGHLISRLIVPEALSFSRPTKQTLWIEYQNAGNAQMPAPTFTVRATHGAYITDNPELAVPFIGFGGALPGVTNVVRLQSKGSSASPDVLQPGESGRIPIYYLGLAGTPASTRVRFTMTPTSLGSVAALVGEDSTSASPVIAQSAPTTGGVSPADLYPNKVNSPYGWRRGSSTHKHEGIDFLVGNHTALAAVAGDGTWKASLHGSEWDPAGGFRVWLEGGGKRFIYMHLNGDDTRPIYLDGTPPVQVEWSTISQGDLIAYSGNTGPASMNGGGTRGYHLHLQMGDRSNPLLHLPGYQSKARRPAPPFQASAADGAVDDLTIRIHAFVKAPTWDLSHVEIELISSDSVQVSPPLVLSTMLVDSTGEDGLYHEIPFNEVLCREQPEYCDKSTDPIWTISKLLTIPYKGPWRVRVTAVTFASKSNSAEFNYYLPEDEDSNLVGSMDPNDKIAPSGFGLSAFVRSGETLPYQIRFENQPSATAPAQRILITDVLDSNLDLSTFELREIAFGTNYILLPTGLDHCQTAIPITANGSNIVVDVKSSLNYSNRVFTVALTAVDTNTGWYPENPLVGLLYPNNDSGHGQGYVSYSVASRHDTPNGTVIRNAAQIVFDYNEPINTPEVSNTVDSSIPSSSVAALPSTVPNARFNVSWSGSDSGAGVVGYDIYYSSNSGPWTVWLVNTTNTTAQFNGVDNTTYRFYSIARDGVGNVQPALGVPDTTTTTPANFAPSLEATPSYVIEANQVLAITNTAHDVIALGEQLQFSLPVAPDGARIRSVGPTNAVFSWTPRCDQGGSTNIITVQVNDTGTPSLVATQSFTVIVRDCVQVSLGNAVVRSGDSVFVPVELLSTVQLSNVMVFAAFPSERFTNFTLLINTQQVAAAPVFDSPGADLLTMELTLQTNHVLRLSTNVATLGANVYSNQSSAFVWMQLPGVEAKRLDGTTVTNAYGLAGRVVIVGEEPLLEALRAPSNQVALLQYAPTGSVMAIQWSTNAFGGNWQPLLQNTQSNLVQETGSIIPNLPMLFFQAIRGTNGP